MTIIITSPSLNTSRNVSGISSMTQLIISLNSSYRYRHFTIGKSDCDFRGLMWFFNTVASYFKWISVLFIDHLIIIHFNIAFDMRGLIRDLPLILISRLLRRRMVIHIHGGEFLTCRRMPDGLKAFVSFSLGKGPIIVLSEIERAALSKVINNKNIIVLPNCIGLNEAKAFSRTYTAVEPLKLLFLGRISESKGIGVIYHALKSLCNQGKKFRFVMAGSGPDESVYVRKFREMLGDAFEFTGVVAGAEKTELLKRCNVFLLPSFFEGLPVALLESMSFGLVPITTNVGSISSFISDGLNGLIVAKNSAADVVSAIDRLSADSRYMTSLSCNARQYVFEHCDSDVYLRKLNAIYEHDYRIVIAQSN